jgi:hypothetical protein
MSEWVSISRDPFARQEIERSRCDAVHYSGGCNNCGNLNGHNGLFKYRVANDGGRKNDIRGKFCTIGCMRSYHS